MTELDVQSLRGTLGVHRLLDAYVERVLDECPGLPEAMLRTWSVSANDAVLIHELLDSCRAPVIVLDVGTFLGASAFLFASHSRVQRVVTLDPNPRLADEINEKKDSLGAHLDPKPLRGVRVHDIARSCLNDFPEASAKVEFIEGGLRAPSSPQSDSGTAFRRFDMSELELVDSRDNLIALVDGLHTAEGVYDDLSAILSIRPDAIVLLDDCRHYWGPFVQAGVARFLTENPGAFLFHLFADLSPALAGSPFAVLYAAKDDAIPEPVELVVSSLSVWMDPLRLLEREQEVVASASAVFERERERELRPPEPFEDPAVRQRLQGELAYLRRISARRRRQVTTHGRRVAGGLTCSQRGAGRIGEDAR